MASCCTVVNNCLFSYDGEEWIDNSIIPDSFHAIEGTCEVFNLSAVRKENYMLPSGFVRYIYIPGALEVSSGLRRPQVSEGTLGV